MQVTLRLKKTVILVFKIYLTKSTCLVYIKIYLIKAVPSIKNIWKTHRANQMLSSFYFSIFNIYISIEDLENQINNRFYQIIISTSLSTRAPARAN
jgi:hypothetical protein